MAFQTGSRVDPRLLDYSGYAQGVANAAAIEASALDNLGKQIGTKLTEFREKKLEKEKKKSLGSALERLMIEQGVPEDEAKIISSEGQKGMTLSMLGNLVGNLTIQDAKLRAERGKGISAADQIRFAEAFESDGVYGSQGYKIVGGKLFQTVDPTPGKGVGLFGMFSDKQDVPITSGPVFKAAEASGLLMQVPELDAGKISQTRVGEGTVLKEPNMLNSLNLDITESEKPTLGQIEDITSKVDYGEFDVPKPRIIEQDVGPSLTAIDRPKTYEEFRKSKRKASDATKEKYQAYLDNFEYKYPKTFEEYSGGAEGDMTQSYTDTYLPRFY